MSFYLPDSPGARRELAESRKRILTLVVWGVVAIGVAILAYAISRLYP